MATNEKTLTRDWINFLKTNQLVELKSNPDGSLIYRKQVTTDDLDRFLRNTAQFDDEAISNAIHSVLVKKVISRQAPKLKSPKQQEPEQQAQIGNNTPAGPKQLGNNLPKKKYNNDDAEDIDFRDINEKIEDKPLGVVDEDDVEAVFRILTTAGPAPAQNPPKAPEPVDPAAEQEKKTSDLNRLKRMIRDTMTDAQRRALWRILTDA